MGQGLVQAAFACYCHLIQTGENLDQHFQQFRKGQREEIKGQGDAMSVDPLFAVPGCQSLKERCAF